MFQKILIANRGEIACRIMKTARRLGIRTVAVYSEADARALHVELADEAFAIGPAPARQSYLDIDRILDVARRSGAQAIHPGYGFLSENAAFADAASAAGIVFIGPPAEAIRAMGLKSAAKELMERAGVPVVPGYHAEAQDFQTICAAAERIGYPVLIKASAGGGGKGMRVVERAADLAEAAASARREAASAFGDERLLLEKYLARPRHIEIQILADRHGNVVSLFERDCSIQRRYQKVIEESPAVGMEPGRRRLMGETACAAARAIGYRNAGTVEFIVEGDAFYFMEMNTRLQVEHPVTEMITGLDLVEWQLRVAAGEELDDSVKAAVPRGHAIEARIYAEDPARGFRPSTGKLIHLYAPAESDHVRVDTGVRVGDEISIHYDPMIAKLIVRDRDRAAAIARLRGALRDYEIAGVTTNLSFLAIIAAHPAFEAGGLDTGFLARHAAELSPPAQPASRAVLAAAAWRVLSDQRRDVQARAASSGDPWSPWNDLTSWRMNGTGYQDLLFQDGDVHLTLRVYVRQDGSFRVDFPACPGEAGPGEVTPNAHFLMLDGVKLRATVLRSGEDLTIINDGINHHLKLRDPLALVGIEEESAGRLTAPMPGRIVQVMIEKGSQVDRGAPLLVLEAMKMEYTITAPAAGTIAEVRCAPGDVVSEGAELIAFA
jgi:3-methylcrotonyl-CoA carboxylase alpha subunit